MQTTTKKTNQTRPAQKNVFLDHISKIAKIEIKESRLDGIRVLLGKWYIFAILSYVIYKAKGISQNAFYLSVYAFGIAVILVLGYTKRPYEKAYEKIKYPDKPNIKEKVIKFLKPENKAVKKPVTKPVDMPSKEAEEPLKFKITQYKYVPRKPIVEKVREKAVNKDRVQDKKARVETNKVPKKEFNKDINKKAQKDPVAEALKALSSDYYVVNDVVLEFKRNIVLKHIVIGPTGIFPIYLEDKGIEIEKDAKILSSIFLTEVQPVIVVTDPKIKPELARSYPVIQHTQLKNFIVNRPFTILDPKTLLQALKLYIRPY